MKCLTVVNVWLLRDAKLARFLFTMGLPGFSTAIYTHHQIDPPMGVGYDFLAGMFIVALFVDAERLGKIDTGISLRLGLERDAIHERKYGKFA